MKGGESLFFFDRREIEGLPEKSVSASLKGGSLEHNTFITIFPNLIEGRCVS
jgi:hypothetical protein